MGVNMTPECSIHKMKHQCEICQKKFLTGMALGGHKNSHQKPFNELKSRNPRINFIINEVGRHCSICLKDTWQGELIPLDLDHVDGNPDNNVRANFRLLCPNCHRLTKTWGSRNKGKFVDSERSRIMKLLRPSRCNNSIKF